MAISILKSLIILSSLLLSTAYAINSSSITSENSIKSLCKTTPHPAHCLSLSLSVNLPTNLFSFLIHTLQTALYQGFKLSNLLSTASVRGLVERQRGTVQDCRELHRVTLSALQRSITRINSGGKKIADARAFLSAALTNRATCLEGLDSATGSLKPQLVGALDAAYAHVGNSLSMLSRPGLVAPPPRRRLLGFPRWLSRGARRALQSSGEGYDPSEVVTVAADGSGNFTTVSEAISFTPNNSAARVFIYVKEGVYDENVEIPSWKPNIVLLGDGSDVTIITGNRSVAGGWTTFRSATVAVSGEGFLASGITFQNTAGPANHQAAALRVNADLAAIYRCTISGHQDTLYVHSFRQFYRECDIYGTIDFIFGNAAAVFQACNIVSRLPLRGQGTVITAQSRDSPDEPTGISIQNCSILATDDLNSNSSVVKSYLGRPWRNYSRTVVLESYIDEFIEPEGWTNWVGDQGLNTLYYGEYTNNGPGSGTDGRVKWAGYHVLDYYDASNFTVSEFIAGDEWLDSTSFPYDDGL